VSDLHPLTAAVTGVLGLASGLLVPRLVAALPEPPPEEPEHFEDLDGSATEQELAADPEPAEPKELYADIAALPGLAVKAAVAAGVSAAALGLVLGWSNSLLVVLPLVPIGVALAVVDWRTRLLPTRLVAPAYAVTVVTILVAWVFSEGREWQDLERAGLGWLVYGGMFFVLWFIYPRGLGYGDVRLSGVLGLALGWVGWAELLLGIWSGLLLGAVVGGLLSLVRRRRDYPFGPFMLLGALVGVVLGQPVISAVYG
jgi:leader peptidase (prepilin peptidase) / N-methyltransferase